MKPLELCTIALEEMQRAGADLADAAVHFGAAIQAEVRENRLHGTQSHRARSASLRAIVNRRTGTYELHSLGPNALREGARIAVEIARNAEVDPDFHDLPYPETYEPVSGVYDARIETLSADRVYQAASANLERGLESAPEAVFSGAVGAYATHGALANTHGIAAEEAGTLVTLDFFCVLRRGNEVGSFFSFAESRGLETLGRCDVAVQAAEKARWFLGSRQAGALTLPLVLAPLASYGLARGLAQAADAEALQRERSFLCGRLGTRILPAGFDIVDDPFVPGGVYSSTVDGEGAARRKVEIVKDGMLHDLLHSSYTANKAGVPNNGHSGRTGDVYPTNISVGRPAGQDGGRALEMLLREVGEAVLLLAGSLEADPVNGKVNTLLDYAMRVEGGEPAYGLKGAGLSGNLLEMLSSIQPVGPGEEIIPGGSAPVIVTAPLEIRGSGI